MYKQLYYSTKLQGSQNDPCGTWKIVRSALLTCSDRSINNSTTLNIHGKRITDSRLIANHFNGVFCNIGSSLAKQFSANEPNLFKEFLHHCISSSVYLNVPNHSEIISTIFSINMNKAVDHDNLHLFFLRIASTAITPYLHSFIEYSFINGVFPDNCTIARIVPLFKNEKRNEPTNYRLTSILSCFSKIFEKIIYKSLISFLNTHNVIQKTQHGFQKNVSTNHAIIDVVTNSLENSNSELYTGLVYLDLTN